MSRQEALAAYEAALRAGQKEYKTLSSLGRDPYPAVLDQMISSTDSLQDLGTIEIPAELIVGVRSAGRTHAFTAGFLPLLDPN